jgi:bifunctional non-homologous end joining protein LigD
VVRALEKLVVGEAALDGEIVADAGFQGLQDGAGVRYVAFDLLWLDGEDLRGRPVEERRELLESLLAGAPRGVELAEEVPGPAAAALARARSERWEGIIAKARGSVYEGRRSRAWLKVKVNASQELAVLGYTPLKNGVEGAIGALLLGVRDGARWRYAGKVGTGYTEAVRRDLWRALEPDRVTVSPAEDAPRLRDARWVAPRLAAEVEFTEWTADGKLRHPSFKGLRPDKAAEECVREQPAAVKRDAKRAKPAAAGKASRRAPSKRKR